MKKAVICIGDSLTEGDYGVKGKRGIANVQEKGYPYFLNRMGYEARNFGKCGFTSVNYLKYYKEGNVRLCGADFIVVMLGTNGALALDIDYQGNKDYDAPSAKILLCTPPHVTENPEYSNCGYAEKVARAVAWVRDYAKKEGLDLIETAEAPAFTVENEHIMQPNDGLHFGEEGYKALAEFIDENLRKYM